MRNVTKNLIIAAAFLTVATVASAETLKADIPFAFRAGAKVMAPGAYTVEVRGIQHEVVVIKNTATREIATLLAGASGDLKKAWIAAGDPVLSFACTSGSCAIASLWNGASDSAITFRVSLPKGEEHAAVADIRLTRASD